jgi:CRP-like cAMP-binding protein
MSVRSDVELLRQVPLFAEVDPAHLQLLVFSSRRIDIPSGDVVFKKGSSESAGYLVLSGRAEAFEHDRAQAPLAQLETGALLGELSMIANLPVSLTVRAKTHMRLLKITHELFMRVCSEFPDAGAKVLNALSRKLDTSLKDLRTVQRYFDEAHSFSHSQPE